MDFSIIIPHKNSSRLLARLIKSVDYNDIQIVVVDDNSNLSEFNKLIELSRCFPFELYKNEGKFAGGARNTGLKYARGKWILFADADDYFEPNLDEKLKKYESSDADIIYFNVISRYNNGTKAYRDEHIKSIAHKALRTKQMDYFRFCYTAPWGKIIRRSLIEEKKISFEEIIAGNDMMFSVLSGLYADKILYDDVPLYCVTVTANSITTTLSRERFDARFDATLRVNDFLRKHKKSHYQISILYFLGKSYQFGLCYMFLSIKKCFVHRSNLFIGMKKILNVNKVLVDRQNTKIK